MSERIDKELVVRGLAPSRAKAQQLILDNKVVIDGKIVNKNNYVVSDNQEIKILDNNILKYVSRGGLKLEKAVNVFHYSMVGKTVLDIGSSTGGFTDCALQSGASKVVAVDVGTDVMDQNLRMDSRIELHENTNLKDLTTDIVKGIDVIVADISFISIKLLIDKIVELNLNTDLILLIKPQFECGRQYLAKHKGVVKDKKIHTMVLKDITQYLTVNKFNILGLDYSPIAGGDGNIEYLCYASNKVLHNDIIINIQEIIQNAFDNIGD